MAGGQEGGGWSAGVAQWSWRAEPRHVIPEGQNGFRRRGGPSRPVRRDSADMLHAAGNAEARERYPCPPPTNGGGHLAPQSRPNGSLRRRTALYWLTRFLPQREKP